MTLHKEFITHKISQNSKTFLIAKTSLDSAIPDSKPKFTALFFSDNKNALKQLQRNLFINSIQASDVFYNEVSLYFF